MALTKEEIRNNLKILERTASPIQKGVPLTDEILAYEHETDNSILKLTAGGHEFDIYRYDAKNKDNNAPLFINIHGGSWFHPHMKNDCCHAAWLASHIKGVVLSVDYTTSREVSWDVMFDQCYETARYAFSHAEEMGCSRERISIGGYSAGGQLTAGVVLKGIDTGDLQFASQIICYAPLDFSNLDTMMGDTVRNRAFHDLVFRHEEEKYKNNVYCNIYSVSDEKLRYCPSTLIITADACHFTNENNMYGNRIALQHVDVTTAHFSKSKHGFIPHFYDYWEPASKLIAEKIAGSRISTNETPDVYEGD